MAGRLVAFEFCNLFEQRLGVISGFGRQTFFVAGGDFLFGADFVLRGKLRVERTLRPAAAGLALVDSFTAMDGARLPAICGESAGVFLFRTDFVL